MSNTLDYGYRSKCCSAPIRFGVKINKKTDVKKKIFICCKCQKRDVVIVSIEDLDGQENKENRFVDDFRL